MFVIFNNIYINEKDKEIVIMNMKRDIFLGLQDISYEIWKLLEQNCNIDEIVCVISDKYNGERTLVKQDVEKIVKELMDYEIIKEI